MGELACGHRLAQLAASGSSGHTTDTVSCLDWDQAGDPMRFSSIFQSSSTLRPEPAREHPRPEAEPEPGTAAPPPDLPEDLDARVRLIGEWQLGEG